MAETNSMFIEGIKDVFVRNSINVFYALIILIVGYVIAVIIAYVVRKTLVEFKVDNYVKEKGKTSIKISSIVATALKWYLILIVLNVTVSQISGLETIAAQIHNIIVFVPTILEAGVVLFLSYIIGLYFKEKVFGEKEIHSSIAGQGLFFLLVLIGIVMSLSIIGIDTFIISAITLVILGSAGLGVAIALGLGLKDSVAELAGDYVKKYKKK